MAVAAFAQLLPAGNWRADPARTRVRFAVRKLGTGTVHGRFADADGRLVVEGDDASASGSVRVASIASGSDERDDHLRAAGFFDAGTYPEIAFASTSIVAGDGGTWRIRGELTIRDRTCEVEFIAQVSGTPGEPVIRARATIDRRDFGLVWNAAVEATRIVSTSVRIDLHVQLTRAPAGQ
jgi:polyisoprenoid-binding protein YceI